MWARSVKQPQSTRPGPTFSQIDKGLMNTTDYLVILAVIISAVVGSLRGYLREAIALVTWIVALFIAWHFSDRIAPHLGGLLAVSPVSTWAARVIIVTLLLLLGTGIGVTVAHFVRLSIFNAMDRFLGFAFGFFRGVVLLGVFVILAQLLRLDGDRWWRQSVLMPYGESIANGLRVVIGDERTRHVGRS
jgi:membrane protein required for colicin V production